MALTLVFVGYDEAQTRRYFAEFIRVNWDIVQGYDPRYDRVWLKDGTLILRSPGSTERLHGLHPDQVVIACDRRGTYGWPRYRKQLIYTLLQQASTYLVDPDNHVLIYDLDAEEERDTCP